ncbi:hypothetical protein, partial [Pseudomonas syringae]|uniref:hypothetical protein n=1 Tax=Pseudomonas syringae TaxID=317 RepID=UPI0019685552
WGFLRFCGEEKCQHWPIALLAVCRSWRLSEPEYYSEHLRPVDPVKFLTYQSYLSSLLQSVQAFIDYFIITKNNIRRFSNACRRLPI